MLEAEGLGHMADDKWIRGLTGDMPLAAAARHVLAVRLGAVRDRLGLVRGPAADDVEHVHQLRVGTRRAAAAVRIFRDLQPKKLARRAKRALRDVRRSAGAARDWDVFLETIIGRVASAPAARRRGLDFLVGYAQGQRACAANLLQAATDAREKDLKQLEADVERAVGDDDESGALRDSAVPLLTELAGELEDAAGGDLRAYESLHRVRILGKRLRYAMEIFESCFGPDFREKLYPRIVAMQDILGKANDSHVAVGRLADLRARLEIVRPKAWAAYRPGVEAVQRYHQRRLGEQRRQFKKWWAGWRASGGAALERLVHAC
jgi:CHAD domain-containing protein